MGARIIDGKSIAADVRAEVAAEVIALRGKGISPRLCVILVGDNPASMTYVAQKEKAAKEVGIVSETRRLAKAASQEDVIAAVKKLNLRADVSGIIVQLPLPKGVDERAVIEALDPAKDVDGAHPINVGRMMAGTEAFLPCTPWGVQELLLRSGNDPAGKRVVILGRSNLVGRPLANILSRKGRGGEATVTLCHSQTKDLGKVTREAEILVSAMGRPRSITAEMVSEGAVVIDVGTTSIPDPTAKNGRRLVGDVDFEAVMAKAKAITPVPGGVGPMTVAMLMKNTVRAARLHREK